LLERVTLRLLSKSKAGLSLEEQNGLAEGLFVLYGKERTAEALKRIKGQLRRVLTSEAPRGAVGERFLAVSLYFGIVDADLHAKLIRRYAAKNLYFTLVETELKGRAGLLRDAREIVERASTTGATFSLARDRGLRSLWKCAQGVGISSEDAARAIWQADGDSWDLIVPHLGDLLRGIDRLHKHRTVSGAKLLPLLEMKARIVSSLLKQRFQVPTGTAGYAYLNELKAEVAQLAGGRLTAEQIGVLRRKMDALEDDIQMIRGANAKLCRVDPRKTPASFFVQALARGEFAALDELRAKRGQG